MKNRNLVLAGLLSLTVACTPEKESVLLSDINAEQAAEQLGSIEVTEILDAKTEYAISNLQWVEKFDLESEIARALQEQDFRLFVIAKRGPNVPGISLDKQATFKKMCGEKYLEGIGDVQFGEAHKKLYNKAIQFASDYNVSVAKNCVKKGLKNE